VESNRYDILTKRQDAFLTIYSKDKSISKTGRTMTKGRHEKLKQFEEKAGAEDGIAVIPSSKNNPFLTEKKFFEKNGFSNGYLLRLHPSMPLYGRIHDVAF